MMLVMYNISTRMISFKAKIENNSSKIHHQIVESHYIFCLETTGLKKTLPLSKHNEYGYFVILFIYY